MSIWRAGSDGPVTDEKSSKKVGGASVRITVAELPDGSPVQWWAEKVAIRECDVHPRLRELMFGQRVRS